LREDDGSLPNFFAMRDRLSSGPCGETQAGVR
jgi:hypothetical protein